MDERFQELSFLFSEQREVSAILQENVRKMREGLVRVNKYAFFSDLAKCTADFSNMKVFAQNVKTTGLELLAGLDDVFIDQGFTPEMDFRFIMEDIIIYIDNCLDLTRES